MYIQICIHTSIWSMLSHLVPQYAGGAGQWLLAPDSRCVLDSLLARMLVVEPKRVAEHRLMREPIRLRSPIRLPNTVAEHNTVVEAI